jgi:hypothetical protein
MNLCKTCIFIEVDREKECYWCILKNIELTNHCNIENCEEHMVKELEFNDERDKIRSNRPAEEPRWELRQNNLRKVWRQLNRFSKSNSRKHSDVQRVLCRWSKDDFKCYN